MRSLTVLLFALVLNAACAQTPGDAPVTVFERVTVVPMDAERVLADHTVVVRGDRIVAVGPAAEVEVPAGATRIDGRGKTLIPGLADLHIHPLSEGELVGYLRHGVTTAFVMRGRPLFLDWRERIERGDLLGPTLYTVGPTTDGFPPLGWKFVGVPTPEDAACVVADQAARGYDAVKVYNQYGPEAFAALNEAAEEAGLPVVGHIPRALGAARALALGQDMVAHGEEFYFADFRQEDDQPDRSLVPAIVEAVRASGAFVTPMLSSTPEIIRLVEDPESLLAEPAMRYASPATYHAYKAANNGYAGRPNPEAFVARNRIMYGFLQELTRDLHDAGVPLLAGTDAGVVGLPGDQLHRELEELVAAGLTSYEALAAATASAGRFAREHLGESDTVGTITVGARADLVLLDADPLADIANMRRIAGVVAQGRWLSIDTLDARAEALAARDAWRRAVIDQFDALAEAGRLGEAVALGREAQRRYGDAPLFHESVVRSHAFGGYEADPEGGVEMLRFNAELYPDFHAVHNMLGLAYTETGDVDAAIAAYERSLALAPCNGVAAAALADFAPRAVD